VKELKEKLAVMEAESKHEEEDEEQEGFGFLIIKFGGGLVVGSGENLDGWGL